jgi:nucleoside-diphosphate-sugar epimerase
VNIQKIGVTGISGFVGENLKKYFLNSSIELVDLQFRKGISNTKLTNINGVIHLAGKAHDLKKSSNSEAYYEVNYQGTKKMYDVYLNSNVKIFIFLSSVKASADSLNDVRLDENYSPTPLTDYGKSKLLAEQYILENLPSDINRKVYILRPCMIHGPGNKGNLNLLYKMVSKGLPWPMGSFKNKRSFCSVENLCFVIKELIEREDIPSGIYNMADSESISTNELIDMIGKSLKKKSLILSIPTKIITLLSRFGDFFHLPLNSERLKKLTENYEVSNQKLVNALGKELPISSREGLVQTFQSFSSNA